MQLISISVLLFIEVRMRASLVLCGGLGLAGDFGGFGGFWRGKSGWWISERLERELIFSRIEEDEEKVREVCLGGESRWEGSFFSFFFAGGGGWRKLEVWMEDVARPTRETVRFEVECGVVLEADLYHPTFGGDESGKYFAVAVFHPHPKLGGNFSNTVVIEMARELVGMGAKVLCVNTRGVGGSTGSSSWKGDAEVGDVITSCRFLQNRDDVRSVYLVGYSYGSALVLSAASKVPNLSGFALVSPPWGFFGSKLLGHHFATRDTTAGIPKIVVAGSMDSFANVNTLVREYQKLPEPKSQVLVPKATHFWFGQEKQAAEPVANFFHDIEQKKLETTTE